MRPSRPGARESTFPDSPSRCAMIKRVLAEPAPISSSDEWKRVGGSAVSSRSHTHTRRKDAPSFSPPGRGTISHGEEKFHENEKIFVGGDAAGVNSDMNLDVLDQNIVSMGQWVRTVRSILRVVLSPAPFSGEPKEKEKEKEKRPRNVLRQGPSANKSPTCARSLQRHSHSHPPTSSPFFLNSHEQKAIQPQISALKAHADPDHHHQQLNGTFAASSDLSVSRNATFHHA